MPKSKKIKIHNKAKNTKKNIHKRENPVITKFKNMLENNPVERQYMNTMISSIPKNTKFRNCSAH